MVLVQAKSKAEAAEQAKAEAEVCNRKNTMMSTPDVV